MMQQTLKCLSVLLTYPSQELQGARAEMSTVIEAETRLSGASKAALLDLIRQIGETDLIDLQAHYVSLFDQGRDLSLHIFEHVHGQSRDRGQAMVDLIALYRSHGFEVSAHELPDYLPLLLEFSAHLAEDEARQLLGDVMPVISVVGARLAHRNEGCQAIFTALAELAGTPEALADKHDEVSQEGPDEALVNMDRIWEEEAVTFMSSPDSCQQASQGQAAVAPVQWVPRKASKQAAGRNSYPDGGS